MITKWPASRFEIPNLKRCKLEEAKAYAYSAIKKRRTSVVYYDDAEGLSSSSSGYDESFSAAVAEVELSLQRLSDRKGFSQSSEKFKRSGRGRPQVPLSRFGDSGEVLEKKNGKYVDKYRVYEEDNVDGLAEGIEELGFVKKRKGEIDEVKKKKFQYCGMVEEEEVEYMVMKS